jgi:hypothetical protein
MIHSMRRHMLAGLLWQTIHLPLHIAVTIMGAAISLNIKYEAKKQQLEVPIEKRAELVSSAVGKGLLDPFNYQRVQINFTVSSGLVLLFLVIISLLHGHKKTDKRLIPHWLIILGRVLIAILLWVLQTSTKNLTGIELLEATCGTWVFLLLFNVIGMTRRGVSMQDTSCHFDLGHR